MDEDGPVSPTEQGCSISNPKAKEDEDGEASDEDDEEDANTTNPSPTVRLNPVAIKDNGPPDR